MAEEIKEEPKEKTDSEKRKEEYEELKKQNDSVEEELLRREQLKAKIALGGQSDAGQTPEKPKELTDKEYTALFLKGEIDPLK